MKHKMNHISGRELSTSKILLMLLKKNVKKVDFRKKAITYHEKAGSDINLKNFKLKRFHFIVICIEILLKIAKTNKWDLCKKNGFIYLFNGRFWNEIEKEEFQFFLGKVALKMGVEKYSGKIHTFKEELYKQFISEAYLPTPNRHIDCVLTNLKNGTFEITSKTQVLRKFKSKDFITYQLPFEYNPEAKCKEFQNFLNEVLPNKEKQKVLAEYLGYVFCKSSVLKLEKMLILYGTGANGKSVVFDIVNALFGSTNISNYTLQSLTNDSGYYRAKIANKLINYASEINGSLGTDIFKQIASGEPIEARLPYGDPFILYDYAKLIFNCNELPKDVEHTHAFFRRFLIIEFDVTIAEDKQDVELSKRIIENELSGIFNWVLQGLDRLLKQKRFSPCEAIDNAKSNYEKQSDSVKMFVNEFKYKPSHKNHIKIKTLYDQYRAYCLEDGFRPVNKSNFIRRLNHHKIYVKRITAGNVADISSELNGEINDGDELPF